MIKVIPNSRKNSFEEFRDGVLRVRVQAPPDKGKANDELIAFLAKSLKLSKSQIKILTGHSSRLKRIEIHAEFNLSDLVESDD